MGEYAGSGSYDPKSMQLQPYHGPPPPPAFRREDFRSYSATYSYTDMWGTRNYSHGNGGPGRDRERKLEKSKSESNFWGIDPELQRKKRVAGYKMYGVEGKVKGSFRKSFRWIKNRYSQAVNGWW
ncbi:hypothetical protein SAY86_030581 [Trapa natans]|uniref:DUF3511 domain protein n=1 Tax=Trapa natans TaxID=22666 RepID=A0AAN7M340_TRANT|nr:hypothetical protein SAY86_030581 [Trapa natans]